MTTELIFLSTMLVLACATLWAWHEANKIIRDLQAEVDRLSKIAGPATKFSNHVNTENLKELRTAVYENRN